MLNRRLVFGFVLCVFYTLPMTGYASQLDIDPSFLLGIHGAGDGEYTPASNTTPVPQPLPKSPPQTFDDPGDFMGNSNSMRGYTSYSIGASSGFGLGHYIPGSYTLLENYSVSPSGHFQHLILANIRNTRINTRKRQKRGKEKEAEREAIGMVEVGIFYRARQTYRQLHRVQEYIATVAKTTRRSTQHSEKRRSQICSVSPSFAYYVEQDIGVSVAINLLIAA